MYVFMYINIRDCINNKEKRQSKVDSCTKIQWCFS